MKKRQIGRTELEVNEVGYGAMHLSIDSEKRPSWVEQSDGLKNVSYDNFNVST